MKGSMNILRLVVFGMMVGLFATSAFADSVQDPKIIIRDPACQPPGCTPVGTSFTFGTPQSGTGALFFNNASGVNWFNLTLVESGVPAAAISCITDVFASCTASTVNGITTILLSGVGGSFTGLLAGKNFSIAIPGRAGWISRRPRTSPSRERWHCWRRELERLLLAARSSSFSGTAPNLYS